MERKHQRRRALSAPHFGPAALRLALALVVVGCGECTSCAGSAALTHEESGRTVVVDAQGFRDFGVGAIGAPHAFGILYPEFRGSGYRVTLTVDDRPVVDVARVPTDGAPSSDMLEEVLDGANVLVSADGDHVALRLGERWHVFHVLAEGTPFDLPDSVVETEEVDLASLPRAEAMALAFLADESAAHDAHPLFWTALDAQPPGPPWDEAVLDAWPRSLRAHQRTMRSLRGAPSDTFRTALETHARAAIESTVDVERERAILALIALDGEALAWLDAHMIATWADLEVALSLRTDAFEHVASRTRYHPLHPIGSEPLSDDSNPALVAAARTVLEARRPSKNRDLQYALRSGEVVTGAVSLSDLRARNADLGLALFVLEHRGGDEDQAFADEVVLAEWPATDFTMLDEAIERRIETRREDAAFRQAVLRRAELPLRDEPNVRGIARILFGFEHPDADDLALRALLAHLDRHHWHLLEEHLPRASASFRRDALAEATWIAEETDPATAEPTARERAAYANRLTYALLKRDDGPCEAFERVIERGRLLGSARFDLPARCVSASPSEATNEATNPSEAAGPSGDSPSDDAP